jgi:hypothetical protein
MRAAPFTNQILPPIARVAAQNARERKEIEDVPRAVPRQIKPNAVEYGRQIWGDRRLLNFVFVAAPEALNLRGRP